MFGLRTYDDARREDLFEMTTQSTAGGSGGAGSYGLATLSHGLGSASFCGSNYITPSGYAEPLPMSAGEIRRMEKARKKLVKQQGATEERRWKNWTLADLSENQKKEIINLAHTMLWEHEWERRIKTMTKGLKWLLIFLGLAFLIHFGKILNLIEVAITR